MKDPADRRPDDDDALDRAATKVGRALSVLATVALIAYLLVTYL